MVENNADRGVRLYPDAVGTMIEGNVIANNGERIDISGSGNLASDDDVISQNVIVDSQRGPDVASFWARGGRIGSRNVFAANRIGGGARAAVDRSIGVGVAVGFAAHENISPPSDPSLRATSRSRTGESTPCARILGAVGLRARSGL